MNTKRYTSTIFLILLSAAAFAQNSRKAQQEPHTFRMPIAPGEKDSVTLKQYFMVMLKDGPEVKNVTDTATLRRLQDGHMKNMYRLYKEGKLLVAGPFGDEGQFQGIFIFDCRTKDEAIQLLATDPKVKAGLLAFDIHPWWTAMNSVFK